MDASRAGLRRQRLAGWVALAAAGLLLVHCLFSIHVRVPGRMLGCIAQHGITIVYWTDADPTSFHSFSPPLGVSFAPGFAFVLPAVIQRLYTPSKLMFPSWPLLLLVLGAAGWIRHQARIGPWQCSRCGYDLTGNVSGVCSECGSAGEGSA